jgi:hypothetical protein
MQENELLFRWLPPIHTHILTVLSPDVLVHKRIIQQMSLGFFRAPVAVDSVN